MNSTDPTGLIDHSAAAAAAERLSVAHSISEYGLGLIAADEARYEQMVQDAFRGLHESTSVTVMISEPTEGKESTQNKNPDTIDNSGYADQSCKISINFKGSGLHGAPNGPGTINTGKLQFGVGLTAEISDLSGGIYKFEAGDKIDNKHGKWKVEQWVAARNVLNGELVLLNTGKPDHIEKAAYKEIGMNSAKWWDHPGHDIVGVDTLSSKKNFYIKAYNGSRHCEVDFHINVTHFFGIWSGEWGEGPSK